MRTLWVVVLIFLLPMMTVYAEEENAGESYVGVLQEQLDYSELDALLRSSEETEHLSFGDMLSDLLLSEEGITLTGLLSVFGKKAFSGVTMDLQLFARLFFIVAISSLFSAFSKAFHNSQVSKMGNYVTFLMLFAVLANGYMEAAALTISTMKRLLDIMNMLVPIYLASITFCTGITSVTAFYQIYIMVVSLMQNIMVNALLPLCNIYLLLAVSNRLPMEDSLGGFASLVKRIIVWGKKCVLLVATGFTTVNGLLAPGVDRLKQSTVVNALSAIPGLGGLFSGATETVLSAGVVLKNAVGIAGVLLLVVMCVRPILKLFLYQLLFRFAAAAVAPIADKSMVACLEETAEAVHLLLGILLTATLSFALVIVIAAVTTSG